MQFFQTESKHNPSTVELRACGLVTYLLFHFYIAFALCNPVYMHNKGKREKRLSAFHFGLTTPLLHPSPIYEASVVAPNNK